MYTKNKVLISDSKCTVAAPGGGKLPPSRNPGKFAKDEEQPRPQPPIRIDSSRKL